MTFYSSFVGLFICIGIVFLFIRAELQLCANALNLPPNEIVALQELYDSTDGAGWAWTQNSVRWNFSGDPNPCVEGWYGVNCTRTTIDDNFLHVNSLDLSDWNLYGLLPRALGNLTQLTELKLSLNRVSGSLPSEMRYLTQLRHLDINSNSLTATLLTELGNLARIQFVNLAGNELTGRIPPEWGRMTKLQYLNLNMNHLTGSLPSGLGNLWQLVVLDLDSNGFSGPLDPELFSNMTKLFYMDMANNLFGGTIGNALLKLPKLEYLDLSNNSFSGTLSHDLVDVPNLLYVSIAYNKFHGCISSLGAIRSLQELDVSHNSFSCSLDNLFNGSETNSSLLNVQLADNQFTGTLPAALFSHKKLQTLVAVSNCFTGTLPQEICQAMALQSLILDGVGASRSCPTIWTTWQLEGQLRIPNRFHGTIPECVFSLPALTSLHLSGNNLVGSISDDVVLSRNLTQLLLSYNLLTGSIPKAMQTHAWSQLDLSYNRFTGSLIPSFGKGTLQGPYSTTANVVVINSRLSGEIPATVLQLPQVSMLGTNMFSCKADKSDVPNTGGNGDKERYQCGSDSFNYAFYLFLSLSGVAAAALLLLLRAVSSSAGVASYLTKWRLQVSSFPVSCQGVFVMISVLCQVAVYCCVPLLLVLVPWYSAASHYYGTYTHQYAWVVSAAFLSGLAPGLVEFFLWATLILFVAWLMHRFSTQTEHDGTQLFSSMKTARGTLRTAFTSRAKAYGAFLWVNLSIVIGANVAFVSISLSESSQAVFLAQLGMSLFKFAWNTFCVPHLIAHMFGELVPVQASTGMLRIQTWLSLFNNIAVPCFVVAILSPGCFLEIFYPPKSVSTGYANLDCSVYNVDNDITFDCTSTVSRQSSYYPQFTYSYQCSSSFITYYSAAMVYFALTAAVLAPAVRLLLCWVVNHTSAESKIHQWSNAALPRLWRVPVPAVVDYENSTTHGSSRYVDANNLLVNMAVYLGILLSFGVVFPPVALAMCVAMLSTAYQTKLAVGRLLSNAREVGAQHVVEAVEQDCKGVASLVKLQSVIVMAIVFACYFYALFIFDTIGDAEGFAGACWVLALWVVVPACSLAYRSGRYWFRSKDAGEEKAHSPTQEHSVELVAIQGQESSSAGEKSTEGIKKGSQLAEVQEAATVSALHAAESGLPNED